MSRPSATIRERSKATARDAIDGARGVLADRSPLDLVIVMSLLTVALHTPYLPHPLVVAVAVAALIHPPLGRHGGLWLAVAAVRAVGHLPTHWHIIDNHQYLLTYWCLALGIALLLRDPRSAIRTNARLLVGLAFAFATVWKLISPDFFDATFFHFTLLVDGRFGAVTQAIGGAEGFVAGANSQALASLTAPGATSGAEVSLVSGPRVGAVATVLTAGTIVLEGAVAVAFLAPARWVSAHVRNAVLLPFIWVTYGLAPVVGFGWLLATMGVAQTPRDAHLTRTGYVATFVLLPVLSLTTGFGLVAFEVVVFAGGVVALTAHMLRDAPILRTVGSMTICAAAGSFVERLGDVTGATIAGIAIGVIAAVLLWAAAHIGADVGGVTEAPTEGLNGKEAPGSIDGQRAMTRDGHPNDEPEGPR